MAILKANNSFLKANGKILVSDDVLKNCYFLTYFDNFDEASYTDIPIIGAQYRFGGKQGYRKSSLSLFSNPNFPCIENYYKNSSENDQVVIKETNEIETVSSEIWLLSEGNRSDYWCRLGFDSEYFTVDPYFRDDTFSYFGPPMTNPKSNTTLYNGTTNPSGNFTKFGIEVRYKTVFLSIVYNMRERWKRFYCNGEIMVEKRYTDTISQRTDFFSLGQSNSGKTFKATGIAFFYGDKSINGGMNYPVPTQRYA